MVYKKSELELALEEEKPTQEMTKPQAVKLQGPVVRTPVSANP